MRIILITCCTAMYVCLCKQVSDNHVVEAWEDGHRDLDALSEHLGLGSGCGGCRNFTRELLDELASSVKDAA